MKSTEEIKKPFADSLIGTEFDVGNVQIWERENDPSVLVRENKVDSEAGQTLEELETSLQEGEQLFAVLNEKYGLRVVSRDSRREKNKQGEETVFTTVDKIEGENLSKIPSLPIEAREELEDVYVSLVQHYSDAWQEELQYWGDCRNDQFVYGSKYGEEEKHFVVVDVDPKFYREGDNNFDTIEAALGGLCGEILMSERKFDPPAHFTEARKSVLSLIDAMLAQENVSEIKQDSRHMLQEAREWLLQPTNEEE